MKKNENNNIIEDSYNVLANRSEGEYKEKGSKFLAYASPVLSIDDCRFFMEEIKDLHPKGRHHCYAYRLGLNGTLYRSNDDGEPSGTAGKPILGQLLSHDVSDTMVIVVRYFGGTKLGASGLINAYKVSTEDALKKAQISIKTLTQSYQLSFTYEHMGAIMNIIKKHNLNISNKAFEAKPTVTIDIPLSREEACIINLKASLLGITTDEVTLETSVPFCSISKIEVS